MLAGPPNSTPLYSSAASGGYKGRALHAARRLDRSTRPVIALSTAHPAKFPEAVEAALGFAPERPPQLDGLEGRTERFGTVDPSLEAVLAAIG